MEVFVSLRSLDAVRIGLVARHHQRERVEGNAARPEFGRPAWGRRSRQQVCLTCLRPCEFRCRLLIDSKSYAHGRRGGSGRATLVAGGIRDVQDRRRMVAQTALPRAGVIAVFSESKPLLNRLRTRGWRPLLHFRSSLETTSAIGSAYSDVGESRSALEVSCDIAGAVFPAIGIVVVNGGSE
jgi:hypothetical protein